MGVLIIVVQGCSTLSILDADKELTEAITDYKEAVIETVKAKKENAIKSVKRPLIKGRKKIIQKLKKETKCIKVYSLDGVKEKCTLK